MPKPKKGWKGAITSLKHFGTIVSHPQQYYRYKTHRDAFVAENHLDLHHAYHGERDNPEHPYPGRHLGTAREAGVIYPGADHHHTVVQGRLAAMAPFDHQLSRGVADDQLGHSPGTLVVMKSEAPGAPPVLRAAVKRGPHGDRTQDDVGRTQHSTLSGGQPVGSAALLLEDGRLAMTSGHHRPDEAAAVKLAIHGKQTDTFLRRETDVVYPGPHHAAPVPADLSLKRRMQVVSDWARRQNERGG